MTPQEFGKLPDGRQAFLYTLRNKSNASVKISTYGAAVVSINVPDKNGKREDVVLGYDDVTGYVNDRSFIGFIVGRYGNRIAKGRFSLDGKEYQLTINDGANHLHGGKEGMFKKLWRIVEGEPISENSLTLEYNSPAGEEGYPGSVTVRITYTWSDRNELTLHYTGSTDAPTLLNPTSHCYFNLSGDPGNSIVDEEVMINAEYFTPTGPDSIPTGTLHHVDGTPFDFRTSRKIGERISSKDEQLVFGKGYDHNWVLNKYDKTVRLAATVFDSRSGRFMEVLTDQPGVQFYSGNNLDGTAKGKNGLFYQYRSALCFETQHFPDSPNNPDFPSVVLRPNEQYTQTTIYRFSTK